MGLEIVPPVAVVSSLRFEDLYRTEYPALIGIATALTGDVRDGEDMVQDTMVKAFAHWRRVRHLERPGGWCHRVLVHACRSLWRRRTVEARFRASLSSTEAVVEAMSDDVIVFWQLVRSLPTRPRTVVALHFAGDLTLAEIARTLNIPEGTVHSDLARARQFIMSAMGGE